MEEEFDEEEDEQEDEQAAVEQAAGGEQEGAAPLRQGEGHDQGHDEGRRDDAADREEDRPCPVDRLALAAEALTVAVDWHSWFSDRKREDALRRLGGPDVGVERRKNAMNGEQKFWVTLWLFAAVVVGFAIHQFAAYNVARANTRPTTEEIIACANACTRSCAAEAAP